MLTDFSLAKRYTEALLQYQIENSQPIISRYCNGQFVGDDPDQFEYHELLNHSFQVRNPHASDLYPDQPWANAYVKETLSGKPINPGEAWKLNEDKFGVTYSMDAEFPYSLAERIYSAGTLKTVVDYLSRIDSQGRQAYIPIWDTLDLRYNDGYSVVPTILGFYFTNREGKLNISVLQRSCDYINHFQNNLFVSHMIQQHVAARLNLPVGIYHHWFGSIHIFKKDWGKLSVPQ